MRERFFYTAIVSFTVGVFVASVTPVGYPVALFLVLLGVAIFILAQKKLVVVILITAAIGISYMEVRTVDPSSLPLESMVGSEISFEGVVVREPIHKERSQQIFVRPEDDSSRDILVLTQPRPRFSYGDVVYIEGKLIKPSSFETETGKVFDYAGYLSKFDVYYQVLFPTIEKVGVGEGNVIKQALFGLKEKFLRSLTQNLPQPHAALAGGLIVGAQEALGDDLLEAFRVTGIIHIVVLSGYNVAIVAEAIMRLTKKFLAKNVALILGGIGIVLFAILTGGNATIVRASLMALLVLVARATHRTHDILRILALAALIMVVHNPHIVAFDPSFQLSFLATLGLIFFAPYIEAWGNRLPKNLGIREFTAATISTQLFVLPLILFSIGEISVVALPVNILILASVPLTMLFGFVSGMFGIVSSILAFPFTAIAYTLLSYTLFVVDIFSRFPFASIGVPSFPFVFMLGVYALYAWILIKLKEKALPVDAGSASVLKLK